MADFMTHIHRTHAALPSGFSWADEAQVEAYDKTGFVSGAAKVVWVQVTPNGRELAVRLRPPRVLAELEYTLTLENAYGPTLLTRVQRDHVVHQYVRDYNAGWTAGGRGGKISAVTTAAWDDGCLDRVAGRPKWHTTYCANHHDNCPEG